MRRCKTKFQSRVTFRLAGTKIFSAPCIWAKSEFLEAPGRHIWLPRRCNKRLPGGQYVEQARENGPNREERQPDQDANDRCKYDTFNGQVEGG